MTVRARLVLVWVAAAVSVLATASPAYAPEAHFCTACRYKRPTYTASWDSQTQSFQIATRLRFDRGVAGDAAGWILRITADVAGAARLGPLEVPIEVSEADRHTLHDGDGVVVMAALAWDGDGGTARGSLVLAGTTELVNPAGRTTAAHEWVLPVEGVR